MLVPFGTGYHYFVTTSRRAFAISCFVVAASLAIAPALFGHGPSAVSGSHVVVKSLEEANAIGDATSSVTFMNLDSALLEQVLGIVCLRPKVNSIGLYDCNFSTAKHFAIIHGKKNLRELSFQLFLSSNVYSNWLQFFDGLHGSELEVLSLQTCNVQDDWVGSISKIRSLRVLKLDTCSKVSAARYRDLGALRKLKSLMLNDPYSLDSASTKALCTDLTDLEDLVLGSTPELGDAGMEAISKLPKLASLRVSVGVGVSSDGWGKLALAKHLVDLDLGGGKLNDEDLLELLSKLELQRLVVHRAHLLRWRFLQSDSIRRGRLRVLSVWVSDYAWDAEIVASLSRLTALEAIELHGKIHADDIAKQVASIPTIRSVTIGDLSTFSRDLDNSMTRTGIEALVNAKQIHSLDVVYLNLSDSVLNELEQRFLAERSKDPAINPDSLFVRLRREGY